MCSPLVDLPPMMGTPPVFFPAIEGETQATSRMRARMRPRMVHRGRVRGKENGRDREREIEIEIVSYLIGPRGTGGQEQEHEQEQEQEHVQERRRSSVVEVIVKPARKAVDEVGPVTSW